jgi:hypothetical protein
MIKKFLPFFVLITLLTTTATAQNNSLKGKWKDNQGIGYEMEFFEDGKGKIGGGGEFLPMEYTVDFTKDPAWIDLTILPPGEPKKKVRGLINFVDEDTFIAEINSEERPTKIDALSLDYLNMVRSK